MTTGRTTASGAEWGPLPWRQPAPERLPEHLEGSGKGELETRVPQGVGADPRQYRGRDCQRIDASPAAQLPGEEC